MKNLVYAISAFLFLSATNSYGDARGRMGINYKPIEKIYCADKGETVEKMCTVECTATDVKTLASADDCTMAALCVCQYTVNSDCQEVLTSINPGSCGECECK